MSNQSKTKSTLTLKSFRGIDHRASHTDEQAASDIINFRIRSDGSLEKRPGFRLLTNLGADIRAFYHKITEGCEIGYALAGNTLFAVDLLTGTKETLGTVTTSTGNACIFFYQSLLYLLDGSEIYVLGNGSLTPVSGYIPLVGKDWPTDVVGEPYEPKNILTRRVRISYAVSADRPSIFMCTGEPVESVEAVWRNGVLLDPEAYYIDEGFGTVNVVGTEKGDRLEIYMTLKQGSDELRRLLLSASRSLFFGGAEDSRLFFWGASDPSLILCTAYVPKESQIASSRLGGNGNDLYFPQGYEFRLGDAAHRIQSCAPHYDRILIFTENDTWMASTDVSGLAKLSLTPINSEIGCAAFNGAVAAGNHPVSIGGSSLYQWNQESNFPDRCNAKRISEEIDDVLTRTMLKSSRLFYDPYHEELWFFHPTNGIVWIRSMITGYWFRFIGVYADRFFSLGSTVGFLQNSAIFLFDDNAYTDWKNGGASALIEARYTGSTTSLGTESYKNLSGLTLNGDLMGGPLFLAFSFDGGNDRYYSILPRGITAHFTLRKRLSSPRFRYGRLSLYAPDTGRPVIHNLTLHTR